MRHTENGAAPDYPQQPDYAIAALLHMLVRFPMTDCRTMADSIAAHLGYVAADVRFGDAVRAAAAQAAAEWNAMLAMRAALEWPREFPH